VGLARINHGRFPGGDFLVHRRRDEGMGDVSGNRFQRSRIVHVSFNNGQIAPHQRELAPIVDHGAHFDVVSVKKLQDQRMAEHAISGGY